jgi:uncharacterized protein (DUF1778 family)
MPRHKNATLSIRTTTEFKDLLRQAARRPALKPVTKGQAHR